MEPEANREVWRVIPGYEGRYMVSSVGRVKSLVGKKARILKASFCRKGYKRASLTVNGKGRTVRIHKLVCLAFIGDRPEGMEVNHKNGDKADNRPDNLEYVTPRQNMLHAYNNFMRKPNHGEKSGRAKVTEEDVRKMRGLASRGMPKASVARKFGLSKSATCAIINHKTWKHVE